MRPYTRLRNPVDRGVYTAEMLCLLAALQADPAAWWDHLDLDSLADADRGALHKMEPKQRGRWLLGRLWNCTDIAPATTCCDVDLPPGSSFARLVRVLARSM